jgi:hypothetical protein
MANRAHLRQLIQDASGNPLPGVSVEVRAVGTTTPIAATDLYADREGGATLPANPVTADSRGIVEFWMTTARRVDLCLTASGYLIKDVPVLHDPVDVVQTTGSQIVSDKFITGSVLELLSNKGLAPDGRPLPALTFVNDKDTGLTLLDDDRVAMWHGAKHVTTWVRHPNQGSFEPSTFVVNNPGYTGTNSTFIVTRTDHEGPVGHTMVDMQYITRALAPEGAPYKTDSSVSRIWGTVAEGDSQIRAIEAQVIRLAGADNATTASDFNTVNGVPTQDERTTTGLKVSQHAGLTYPQATLTTSLGDDNDLVYTARYGGTPGNNISVEYVVPPSDNQGIAVTVDRPQGSQEQHIIVTLQRTGGAVVSTASEVKAALETHEAANSLVYVDYPSGGTGAGGVTGMNRAFLHDGSYVGLHSGRTSYLPDVEDGDDRKNHGTALMLWGDMGWASYLRCYGPDMDSPIFPGKDLRFEIERSGEVATIGGIRFRDAGLGDYWKSYLDAGAPAKAYRLAAMRTNLEKLQIDWAPSGDFRVLPAVSESLKNTGKLLVGGPTPSFQVDTATGIVNVAGRLAVGDPSTAGRNAELRFIDAGADKWMLYKDDANHLSIIDLVSGVTVATMTPGTGGANPVAGSLLLMPAHSAYGGVLGIGAGVPASDRSVHIYAPRGIRIDGLPAPTSSEQNVQYIEVWIDGARRVIPHYPPTS